MSRQQPPSGTTAAQTEATQPATPAATPKLTRKPRERSPAARAAADAASGYSRLEAIDREEVEELAQSPQAIKAKHEARRQKVIEGLSEEARRLVEKMRRSDD